MDDVADYLEIDDSSGRHECPICGSSDGLGIDPDQGDTGSAHCFSCMFGEQEAGTGAMLYAEVEGVSIGEALDAFGIEADDLSREVKQKEQIAPKPETPDYTDAEQRERRRAYQCMSAEEIRLRADYRRKRAAAQERRNRAEFDKWQGKLDALIDHVLRKERIGQREIQ